MKTVIIRRRYIVLIVMLLFGLSVKAQMLDDLSTVRTQLDSMFTSLEKQRVPTGLLLDYAVNLVDFQYFNGTNMTDSSIVNFSTYKCLLSSIRSAAVVNAPFGELSGIVDTLLSKHAQTGTIPISIAAFKYNYIRQDAILNNLINYSFSTGRVSDRYDGDTWINPYDSSYVIGFSPIKNIVYSTNVTYSFDTNNLFTNLDITSVQFDAGDGYGYRPLNEGNQSISYTAGDHELKLKVFIAGRTTPIEAHSIITVYNEVPMFRAPRVPSSIKNPDDTCIVMSSIDCNGVYPSAMIFVKYATGRDSVQRPFIVVEGIDPIRFNDKYARNNRYRDRGFTNFDLFYDPLPTSIKRYYDIIYVDWDLSTASIQSNADILIQVIRQYSGLTEPIVVMGQSMGGLVARYAIRTMEIDGEDHHVSTFLSHDSPHLGANVPLGYVFLAQYLRNLIGPISLFPSLILDILDLFQSLFNPDTGMELSLSYSEINSLLSDLLALPDSPAVRQMLYNYVNAGMVIDNSVHDSWQNTINALGFPRGDGQIPIKNLCISNGGNDYFDISQDFADIEAGLTVDFLGQLVFVLGTSAGSPWFITLLRLLPTVNQLDCHFSVKPFTSLNQNVFTYNITLTKTFFWCLPVHFTLDSNAYQSTSTGVAMDQVKSSFYKDVNVFGNDVAVDTSITLVGGVKFIPHVRDTIPFIPTASSLCYKNGAPLSLSEYNYSFNNTTSYIESTPFDAYYLKDNNTLHISLHSPSSVAVDEWTWLLRMKDLCITGPEEGETGSVYALSDTLSVFTNLTWSVVPYGVASISSNGVLTINNPTVSSITIKCKGLYDGNPFRLSKTVEIDRFEYSYYLDKTRTNNENELVGKYMLSANRYLVPVMNQVGNGFEMILEEEPEPEYVMEPDTLLPFLPLEPLEPMPRYHWSVVDLNNNIIVRSEDNDSLSIHITMPYGAHYSVLFSGLWLEDEVNTCSTTITNGFIAMFEPIPVDPEGCLHIAEDGEEEYIIPVRGEVSSVSLTLRFGTIVLNYNRKPSLGDIMDDLLDEEDFVNNLKSMRPWGDSPYLMIPYTVTDNNTDTTYEATLKFLYQ